MSTPTLHFRENGSFRLLFLSDFQETYTAFDPRTLAGMNAILDAEQPDLVVLCGDNCNGPMIHSTHDLQQYLDRMLDPIVQRGIPWCHVCGNHDYDAGVPMEEQLRIYQSFPGCLTTTVSGIPGLTNFVLPVYSSDGERIVSAVWGLDTGNSANDLRKDMTVCTLYEGHPRPAGRWDMIRFEQQMWYWNQSIALEKQAGGSVPAVMAMHIAPWEFEQLRFHPDQLHVTGNFDERYDLAALNSGIFATLLQRGDVRCICCGHTHRNTCQGVFCGIRLCSVGSAGYSAYGEASLRGGRVVELLEADPATMHTRMVYFRDLLP